MLGIHVTTPIGECEAPKRQGCFWGRTGKCYKSMMRPCLSECSHTVLLLQRKPCTRGIWGSNSEVVHVVFGYSINVDFIPITV